MMNIILLCASLALMCTTAEFIEATAGKFGDICHQTICQVTRKLDEESNKRNEFEIDWRKFALEHNIKSAHVSMNRLLSGSLIEIEDGMPLQAYVIEHQQLLYEMTKVKLDRLQDESENLLQLLNDDESVLIKKIEEKVSESEKNILTRLNKVEAECDSRMNKYTQLTWKQNQNLRDELNELNRNISRKLVDHQNVSVGLHAQAEIKWEKYLEDEFVAMVQLLNEIEWKIGKKMEDHFNKNQTCFPLTNQCRNQENEIENLKNKVDEETAKNKNLNEQLLKYKTTISIKKPEQKPAFDCLDIQKSGKNESGVYEIFPRGKLLKVYCDMDTDGGGWTVFILRKRQSNQLNFRRKWRDYKIGFGTPPAEYWLGLDALYLMTSFKRYSMRADATGAGDPTTNWVKYSHFQVDSEATKYRLTLTGYDSNSVMRDFYGFGFANQYKFSTIDRDNDIAKFHCAVGTKDWQGKGGGFWFTGCGFNIPTHPYRQFRFYLWSDIDRHSRQVFTLQMKIRPRK